MCDESDWEQLIEQIDELLDDERYEFATDTLEGIREWVSTKEHCTENQQQAVQRIENCKQ